jgi:RNA-directed DNA polymerase
MSETSDDSTDGSPPRTPFFERLARSIAEFLRYSRADGYSLDATHIRARAQRHFGEHASLVGAVLREFQEDFDSWQTLTTESIAEHILASNSFSDFSQSFDEDAAFWCDDETLEMLRNEYDAARLRAASLPAWIPPRADAHEWLRTARSSMLRLETAADIAHALDVSCEEFDAALANKRYRLRTHAKATGGVRLIEIPSEPLRVLQRRLLHRMFDHVAPHESAHAYVRGRSVHTHASNHTGRGIVIRLDLEHFFPSISGARVFLLFRALGYRAKIANALTDLCVASQSRSMLRRAVGPEHSDLHERYSVNHLPQGAPTSPALANLCVYSLDTRLQALAERFGATYSRYADDLVFSGDDALAARASKFIQIARSIVATEGFRLNTQKTRVMRHSARQSFAGLVVNKRVNIARRDYDQLKAAVHRATKNTSEHVVASLLGRIAWLGQSSPSRAKKLREKLLSTKALTQRQALET